MFENKLIKDEIHATRYIASWIRAGGQLYYGKDIDNFYKWLLSMGLTEHEAYCVKNLATCGKLELEFSANKFLNTVNSQK